MDNGEAKTAAQPTTEQLAEELKAIAAQAEELIEAKGDELARRAREIRDRLGNVLDTAQVTVDTIEAQASAGLKKADRTIRAHPYQSIGLALGIGLAVGLLMKRH